jgi:LytR cell envelope-related transcriptional attenuator
VDAPLPAPDALIRPWRTATMVASLVAAVELILLIVAAILLLAKPLAHAMQHHAEAAAFAPAKKHVAPVKKKARAKVHVPAPKLLRSETGVFVFNGNGRSGAASSAASRLSTIGYRIRGTGNAKRQDYATTVVMYRPGYEGDGLRLARTLHVKVVGPLDGISSSSLHGAQLVVVLGAR